MVDHDIISITIPCKAEYSSVLRLAFSSILVPKGASVDEIEDFKIILGELLLIYIKQNKKEITIKIHNYENKVGIEIAMTRIKEYDMSLHIIEALMDEITIDNENIFIFKNIK